VIGIIFFPLSCWLDGRCDGGTKVAQKQMPRIWQSNEIGVCLGPVLPGTGHFWHWTIYYADGMKSHLVYATVILEFPFIFAELNPMLRSNETNVVVIGQEAR